MTKPIYAIAIVIGLTILGCGRSSEPSAPHSAALDRLSDAMREYRVSHGHWPQSLTNLPNPSIVSFRGQAFRYNPTNLWLTLPVDDIPAERSFAHKVTFGRLGSAPKTCALSVNLEELDQHHNEQME